MVKGNSPRPGFHFTGGRGISRWAMVQFFCASLHNARRRPAGRAALQCPSLPVRTYWKLHVTQLAPGPRQPRSRMTRSRGARLDDHLRQVSRLRAALLVLFRALQRQQPPERFTVTLSSRTPACSHRNIVHRGCWGGICDQRWVVHRLDSAARGGTSGANQDDQQRCRK